MPAHFTHWYLNNIPNPHWATWIFRTIIGSTFQFIFVTLPGMSVILELYNAKIKGIDEKKLKIGIIKRGLILIILQFFCNSIFYDPQFTWNWFILSFIGISIILSYYLSKISQRARIIIIVAIIALAPFLKYIFFNVDYLLQDPWTIEQFLYQMFLNINFPIFSYVATPIFGTLYAEKMIKAIETDRKKKFVRDSLLYGSLLIIFYFFTLGYDFIFNFPDIPFYSLPTRQAILNSFGMIMVVNGIFFWAQDWKQKKHEIFDLFKIFNGISLTVFITHFYVFAPIFDLIYNPIGNLSFYSVFLLCTLFWIIYSIYGYLWKKNKRKYSFEWFMRELV